MMTDLKALWLLMIFFFTVKYDIGSEGEMPLKRI